MEGGTTSLRLARAAGLKMPIGTDLLGELQTYQSDEFRIRSEVLGAADVIRSATSHPHRHEGRAVLKNRGH
jgi:imidazolonepropionase-like amidohydrolase